MGVLPRAFALPNWDNDIFVAAALDNDPARADRGNNFLRAIARLKPGVTPAQAQAEFAELNVRLVRDYPDENGTVTAPRFVPLRDEVVGGYRASLLLLLGAAAALLLIMCANLAGLLAARAIARRRDAAICSALGASPARLVRAYLAEGLLIATAGGALGVLACWWGLDALLALAPSDLPRANQVALDFRMLGVAAGSTLLIGIGIGLAPALQLARVAPQDVLKSGSAAATSRTPARSVLVAAQIALCTALLVGTGLLVRSLHRLLDAKPGFVSTGVLVAQVSVPRASYRTIPVVLNFTDEFLRRLRGLPGTQSASLTSVLPLTGINTRSEFTRADRPPARPSDVLSAANRFIAEDYFATTGIPLMAGRDFTPDDNATGRPVVIVDQALARRHWPGEDALGKTILLRDSSAPAPRELEIVGIVGPTKNFTLEETATPALYFPVRQIPAANLGALLARAVFVVKAAGDPLALKEPARRELRAVDPDAAVSLRSFDEAIAWARAPRVFNIHLLAFFSASAVLLAALGLYAITAQSVAARTREIGIRIALGASGRRIARDVIIGGARLAAIGVGAGAALAAAVSPLLTRMLYQIDAVDPVTYGAVAAGVTIIALVACWLPAHRATRVDPITALRAE